MSSRGITEIYNGGLTQGAGRQSGGNFLKKLNDKLKQHKPLTEVYKFTERNGINDKLRMNPLGRKLLEGAESAIKQGYGRKKRRSKSRKH
jgi:hypothetical protein